MNMMIDPSSIDANEGNPIDMFTGIQKSVKSMKNNKNQHEEANAKAVNKNKHGLGLGRMGIAASVSDDTSSSFYASNGGYIYNAAQED